MKTFKILEIINQIADLSGKLKIQFLADAVEADAELKRDIELFFQMVFDRSKTYRITEFNLIESNPLFGEVAKQYEFTAMIEFLENVARGLVPVNNQTRSQGNMVYSGLHKFERELTQMILDHDLKCGMGLKSVMKVFPDLIQELGFMKCESFDVDKVNNDVHLEDGAYSQLKSDGVRCAMTHEPVDKVQLLSFNQNPFLGLDDLQREFAALRETDGELYVEGELVVLDRSGNILPRKTGNGIINKATQGTITPEEAKRVRMIVWDIVPAAAAYGREKYEVSYKERFERIQKLFGNSKYIIPTESRVVTNLAEAKRHYFELLARGEEGTILKSPHSLWKNGRSKNQVKFKEIHEGDFIITGWLHGDARKKYEHCIGRFQCRSKCGEIEFEVGSGLSDEMRGYMKDGKTHSVVPDFNPDRFIGQVVEILYNNRIQSKVEGKNESLFLPRVVEVRFDKDAEHADTRDVLIKREEASRQIGDIDV